MELIFAEDAYEFEQLLKQQKVLANYKFVSFDTN